jgi:catechol-2,3-dioxygenase
MSRFPDFEFSHTGLHVFDPDRMIRFYKDVFGFVETDRGVVHGKIPVVFLSRSARDHHQVVIAGGRTAPLDSLLLNQLSFRLASLVELRAAYEKVASVDGASDIRCITHGNAFSVYFKDPEGNKLELFTDSPWYVEQPVLEPFDLTQSDEEILAATHDLLKDMPGFKAFEEWSAELRQRLDEAE